MELVPRRPHLDAQSLARLLKRFVSHFADYDRHRCVDSILNFKHHLADYGLPDHPAVKVPIRPNGFDRLVFYCFIERFLTGEFREPPAQPFRGNNANPVKIPMLAMA